MGGSKGTYPIINPATEELVGLAPEGSADDARKAAAAAAAAFPAWSQTTPAHRAELLEKVAVILESRYGELIPLVQAETGSTLNMTRTIQVPHAAVRIRRYVRGAAEPMEMMFPPVPNHGGPGGPGTGLLNAMAVRAPVGVVGCITSYNVPLSNVVGKIAPALVTGNTVIVKPAHQDPLGVIEMIRAFNEAGFPPGVVNLVLGSTPEVGEALVASPDVTMVSFTGSSLVGRMISEAAATGFKRIITELGGKGAALVLDGADLDNAAQQIASTWTFHMGQICTAPTRVIAQRGVYEQLVDKLAKVAQSLKVGDPLAPDTVLGPVITGAHRARVEAMVASGIADGATPVTGGARPELDKGFFVAPTLLAGATNQMHVAREEIFGPVVVVIPFDDEEEGIAIANDSNYGLYGYVFSGDTAHGMAVAKRLRSGNVGINTANRNPETPFGGVKESGMGRDGGSFAMHAYTEWQSLVWPS
ncbi:MAG TPA: aldehyde dehydrogenase family protein [Acidimicrobiales bacterium]|nr:aldehyde dehydrogenase family protein [Acidimicrobiales bacterium]